MGSHTLEVVSHLNIGQAAAGHHCIEVGGMPGHGGIQLIKDALPSHKGLAGTTLLAGGAEVDHGTAAAGVLQVLLDTHRRGNGAHTEHIVSAAVTGGAGSHGLPDRTACLLAQAGQGIKFAQDTDHRLAAAIAGREGGFDAGHSAGHHKTLLLQLAAECLRRPVLGKGQLGIVPDLIAQRCEIERFGIDHLIHRFLIHFTGSFLWVPPVPQPEQGQVIGLSIVTRFSVGKKNRISLPSTLSRLQGLHTDPLPGRPPSQR